MLELPQDAHQDTTSTSPINVDPALLTARPALLQTNVLPAFLELNQTLTEIAQQLLWSLKPSDPDVLLHVNPPAPLLAMDAEKDSSKSKMLKVKNLSLFAMPVPCPTVLIVVLLIPVPNVTQVSTGRTKLVKLVEITASNVLITPSVPNAQQNFSKMETPAKLAQATVLNAITPLLAKYAKPLSSKMLTELALKSLDVKPPTRPMEPVIPVWTDTEELLPMDLALAVLEELFSATLLETPKPLLPVLTEKSRPLREKP